MKTISYLTLITFSLDNLNNLNRLQGGLVLVVFGIIFTIVFKYFHKSYQNEGFRPFQPFRREGKTEAEDALFVFLYMRSLIGVYLGYSFIISGVICIVAYFT